jgi:hypothetical protein
MSGGFASLFAYEPTFIQTTLTAVPSGGTAVYKTQLLYLEFKKGKIEEAHVRTHEEILTAVCVFCTAAESERWWSFFYFK